MFLALNFTELLSKILIVWALCLSKATVVSVKVFTLPESAYMQEGHVLEAFNTSAVSVGFRNNTHNPP